MGVLFALAAVATFFHFCFFYIYSKMFLKFLAISFGHLEYQVACGILVP